MAAYAALVSLMHIIDDIEHHHSPPISIQNQQVDSLTEIVSFLQEFLQGYTSPVADADEADPLETRIADAAYAAEDVIESHIFDQILPSNGIRFFNCLRIPKNVDVYQDLQQVIEELNVIKIDAEKAAAAVNVSASVASSSRYSSSSTTMVCSDDVLNGIMEKLTRGRPDRQVVPIVGMGGIGKTTLARTVYSNSLIKEHFDIRAWATISQKYNTREILCELVSQATKRKKEELGEMSEDKLGLELYQSLLGRRFLIVMDDMWSIDAWEEMHHFFPNKERGSRVLVTTRLFQLSSQLNNNYSLRMKFLDEVSSWDLFVKTVFGEESCPLELMEAGKRIVENCRGLPLSIVVVGGLLKKMEHTQECWESIRKNLNSVVNLENDKHCLRLLQMSYNHLPVYLKPCFLYMGVFEEDDEIRVSTLIQLWVCEGFLKPINGKSLETIAEEFLKDLVDRNLIMICRMGSIGNIKYCKIHDLLRDLCLNQGKKDGFYHVIGQCSPRGINSQRRVVIPRNTSKKKVLDDLQYMSHARSIICEYGKVPRCRNFGLLRTLHAYKVRSYKDESDMNPVVFGHVNLRHLAIKASSMSSFFSSVNLLWNLHTLIVSCTCKSTAPTEIWKMPQFRRIEFAKRNVRLPDPPSDVVIMKNLHVLKGVKNFKCGEDVVKRIPNIKKLGIQYCGREGTGRNDYYCLGNINSLRTLESLYISCDDSFRGIASLRNLTFPHSLKKLSLELKSEFEWQWEEILDKIASLPLLEKLKLFCGCFGTCKWKIVEGQFSNLKYLGLFLCRGLKQWTVEQSSILPRLEQLRLFDLQELDEIPSEIGNIPTLQKLWLTGCSESAVMSAKNIVDEQVELQGEQLSFNVEVWLAEENEALQSLAGPNFKVLV